MGHWTIEPAVITDEEFAQLLVDNGRTPEEAAVIVERRKQVVMLVSATIKALESPHEIKERDEPITLTVGELRLYLAGFHADTRVFWSRSDAAVAGSGIALEDLFEEE